MHPDPSTMTDAEIPKMFHCAFVTIAKTMEIIQIELRRIKAEAEA